MIATLVVGFVVALPGFVIWEWKFAKHPLVPFKLLKQRTILAGLVIAAMLKSVYCTSFMSDSLTQQIFSCAWYLQGDYLYAILVVAFDETPLSAQRISSVYSFTSVLVGVSLGVIVRYVRRLKPFVIAGTCIFMVAYGVLIHYRGGDGNKGDISGMIGGQFLLGFGGGMFPYPTQALVQAAAKHEHVAMVTALYLAVYRIGSARESI